MVGAWLLLIAAITVEVGSTASLSRTNGFRDPGWTAVVLAGYAASIWLLALVVKQIPVSVAYAVWSGLGTAGIVVIGLLFLGERIDPLRATALAMIIVGVVVLNLHTVH